MEHVKILFIDWHNTLSYNKFWEHLQTEGDIYKNIEASLFGRNKACIVPWMLGEYTTEDIIEKISRDTGLSSAFLLTELKKSCEQMQFCIPNLVELVKRVQDKGIKVVIATDNMDAFQRFTVPALRLTNIFDDILNSANLQSLKDQDNGQDTFPFFDAYLQQEGVTYQDVLLLDDTPEKHGKYMKLGFRRMLIKQPKDVQNVLEQLAR